MPLRNRVLPTGVIVADAVRGTLTGNRGCLVGPDGRMGNRQWAAKAWITCVLEFRGRRRPIAQPRTWTELFFLDEAVAFAAGHRPCAYCRRAEYTAYRDKFPGAPKATEMDIILHQERLEQRVKRLHPMSMEDLPDGAFVLHEGTPHLILGNALLRYAPDGYSSAIAKPSGMTRALTPPATLAALKQGYRPKLHATSLAHY